MLIVMRSVKYDHAHPSNAFPEDGPEARLSGILPGELCRYRARPRTSAARFPGTQWRGCRQSEPGRQSAACASARSNSPFAFPEDGPEARLSGILPGELCRYRARPRTSAARFPGTQGEVRAGAVSVMLPAEILP